jgi:hypothetical protein
MRHALIAAALALGSVLAGCASLSARQCQAGDWARIGRDDGERGLPPSQLENHREACARHGIEPDADQYRAARTAGLRAYCTEAGAYVSGRRGDRYHGVCAPALEKKVLPAYRHGRDLSYLLRDIKELRLRVEELERTPLAGDYNDAEQTHLRWRAEELRSELQRRESDAERLDRRYARDYGAPPLSPLDFRY